MPSAVLQLLGGTAHSHRPPRDEEPRPPEKMPPCPDHLDERARKEWDRVSKLLEDVGLLTELDMATLAGYCDAYSQWARASIEVQTKGMVYVEGQKKDADGNIIKAGIPKLNPYIRVAREAFDRMMKNAVLIGMSPSSRASLKVPKKRAPGKVEKFMGRKNGAPG